MLRSKACTKAWVATTSTFDLTEQVDVLAGPVQGSTGGIQTPLESPDHVSRSNSGAMRSPRRVGGLLPFLEPVGGLPLPPTAGDVSWGSIERGSEPSTNPGGEGTRRNPDR